MLFMTMKQVFRKQINQIINKKHKPVSNVNNLNARKTVQSVSLKFFIEKFLFQLKGLFICGIGFHFACKLYNSIARYKTCSRYIAIVSSTKDCTCLDLFRFFVCPCKQSGSDSEIESDDSSSIYEY